MTDNKNIDSQKGFSGLDSLLSDTSDSKNQTSQKQPVARTKEEPKKNKKVQKNSVRKPNESSPSRGMIFIIFVVILLIYIFIMYNNDQKTSLSSPPKNVNIFNRFDKNTKTHAPSPSNQSNIESVDPVLASIGICEIQELLMGLGEFSGKVDGLMGPNTNKSISNFSTSHRIQYNGTPTKGLLEQIKHIFDKSERVFNSPANLRNPNNGYVFSSTGKIVAPLKIKTDSGSNYYVKIVDAFSKQTIKSFFIRSSLTVNTKVPLGTYEIRYASGKQWFSQNCLFGRNTSYNKAGKTFTFNIEGNRVSGYSIELIKQVRGNLHTTQLKCGSF